MVRKWLGNAKSSQMGYTTKVQRKNNCSPETHWSLGHRGFPFLSFIEEASPIYGWEMVSPLGYYRFLQWLQTIPTDIYKPCLQGSSQAGILSQVKMNLSGRINNLANSAQFLCFCLNYPGDCLNPLLGFWHNFIACVTFTSAGSPMAINILIGVLH